MRLLRITLTKADLEQIKKWKDELNKACRA
jgi:hypothetical protein